MKALGGSAASTEKLARITFAVFMFFMVFGTRLPFKDTVTDIGEKPGPSIFNRALFTIAFALSSYCLARKWKEVLAFARREKFLSLFLMWCVASSLWADIWHVALKNSFQTLATVTVCLAALLSCASSRQTLVYVSWTLYAYGILSILSIAMPQARDPQFAESWRGLSMSKNHLGQACVASILVWLLMLRSASGWKRVGPAAMLCLAFVLLAGSRSMTSIMTLILLAALGALFFAARKILPLKPARIFAALALLSFAGIVGAAFLLHPHLLADTTRSFGRDPTFTGRTELWEQVWADARRHLTVGCGFGSFWILENPDLLELYETFTWLPNQAHLGYLDLVNETGLVGLALFGLMTLNYAKNAFHYGDTSFWHRFVVCSLIINFQETTLFRPNFLTGVLFMLAYTAFYVDCLRTENVLAPAELAREAAVSPDASVEFSV